jgi:hypothetical protein
MMKQGAVSSAVHGGGKRRDVICLSPLSRRFPTGIFWEAPFHQAYEFIGITGGI